MSVASLADPHRLAALEASGLLDKNERGRLSHLTYSAVMLTGADISQINVLGAVIQHTIAQHPLPLREPVPVGVSACYEVIRQDATVVIADAANDPNACDLPWAQEFRAFLGTPVHHDGEPIGSMCVVNVKPREWRSCDRMAVEGLARLVSLSVELDRR